MWSGSECLNKENALMNTFVKGLCLDAQYTVCKKRIKRLEIVVFRNILLSENS